MRVLFATAELAPLAKVGGLGDFSAGFSRAIASAGHQIEIALPDYGQVALETQSSHEIEVPQWCSPATVKTSSVDGLSICLISVPEMARPNPYLDSDGRSWPDNDRRFFGFSAALASWAQERQPEVLHINDWHTSGVLAFLADPPPTLLTIHNLAYQGTSSPRWVDRFPCHRESFLMRGETNPLAGGIALADRIVAVSPRFVTETLPPNEGFGLSNILESRGAAYTGILNGIDTDTWDPGGDPYLDLHYDSSSIEVKNLIKKDLEAELGLEIGDGPLIGMVTRLTEQKGVDIALEAFRLGAPQGSAMVLLGSGERALADAAEAAVADNPGRFAFFDGYDERLSHRIFGAADLYLMPSRFEPAGLTQMQAMRYGAIPVVTDVGGLHDTVVDADAEPSRGTGFVASAVTGLEVASALARAVSAWRVTDRRRAIAARGMAIDWSWHNPAQAYLDLYREITSAR